MTLTVLLDAGEGIVEDPTGDEEFVESTPAAEDEAALLE